MLAAKEMEEIGNWIWETNLRPLVEVLAWLADYELFEGEWDLIRNGVCDTDSDAHPPRWFDHEFLGRGRVAFSLAKNGGSSVISVRLSAEEPLRTKLEFTLDLMNQYEFVAHEVSPRLN